MVSLWNYLLQFHERLKVRWRKYLEGKNAKLSFAILSNFAEYEQHVLFVILLICFPEHRNISDPWKKISILLLCIFLLTHLKIWKINDDLEGSSVFLVFFLLSYLAPSLFLKYYEIITFFCIFQTQMAMPDSQRYSKYPIKYKLNINVHNFENWLPS